MNVERRTLVVATALSVVRAEGDGVILTRKFMEGMKRYAELWQGPVRCLAREASSPSDNLDNAEVQLEQLPFELCLVPDQRKALEHRLRDAAVLLVAIGVYGSELAAAARQLQVPVVLITELSLRTRLQMMQLTTTNPLLRVRRAVWQLGQEHHQRQMVRQVAGVQCNGFPTFNTYRQLNDNALLFFDSRHTQDTVRRAQTEQRLSTLVGARPLQLAYSGRLIPIKGVDHLVPIAARLRKRGMDFRLRIFGAGVCEAGIRAQIAAHGLEAWVSLEGSLAFAEEWLPLMRREIDLFLCCHRQGDPSCTYLEAMACGVPVAGYANEAVRGLLALAEAGVATATGDLAALVDAVIALDRDRPLLARYSQRALDFAEEHCFEQTFRRRVDHVARLASRAPL